MNQQGLPVKQHIVELRKRLTWAVLSVVICTALAFVFHQQILTLLMEPARGFSSIPNEKPIYTEMTEYLGIAMKVSLLAGLVLASPFVLLQLGLFDYWMKKVLLELLVARPRAVFLDHQLFA